MVKRILLSGEGGQGVQVLAHVLTKAAFESGLHVAFMPNYGVEQRGGVSIGYLQIGTEEIGFPKFREADIIVVMCERAVERVKRDLGIHTLFIYDTGAIDPKNLKNIYAEKLPVPATETASIKLEPRVANMVLAGALLTELPEIKKEVFLRVLEEELVGKYKKKPQLKNLNKKAFEFGERLAKEAYTPPVIPA